MRLIDADKLKKQLSNTTAAYEYDLCGLIDTQPTAYCVKEVENQLKESCHFSDDCDCDIVEYQTAIEIITGRAVRNKNKP